MHLKKQHDHIVLDILITYIRTPKSCTVKNEAYSYINCGMFGSVMLDV